MIDIFCIEIEMYIFASEFSFGVAASWYFWVGLYFVLSVKVGEIVVLVGCSSHMVEL